jgi:hypothetical protein
MAFLASRKREDSQLLVLLTNIQDIKNAAFAAFFASVF